MFYVYIIQNNINDKIYIGKTKSVRLRKNAHFSKSHNVYLRNSLKKYGKENFEFIPIQAYNTELECFEAEKFWIAELKIYNINLYNITEGGEGVSGLVLSKEHKEKISKALKGRPTSEEHRKNLSIALKGRPFTEKMRESIKNANTGKKQTPEHREKCKLAKIGKKRSPDVCKAISKGSIGKKFSPEHILHLSESHKGLTRTRAKR